MMPTVAEAIAAAEAEQRLRVARAEQSDKYRRFYSSRAFRAARYAYLKKLPRPLRCMCCGATAKHARLCVDHRIPLKRDWTRRLDQTNFQLLCTDCNLAKASTDTTDWRPGAGASEAATR
jgi:5-methylcytosine-specific restriction endonuclease McrA